jgi:hypothetical protein
VIENIVALARLCHAMPDFKGPRLRSLPPPKPAADAKRQKRKTKKWKDIQIRAPVYVTDLPTSACTLLHRSSSVSPLLIHFFLSLRLFLSVSLYLFPPLSSHTYTHVGHSKYLCSPLILESESTVFALTSFSDYIVSGLA